MYHFKLSQGFKVIDKGKPSFRCTICSLIYRHEFSIKRHYLREHVNRSYITEHDLHTLEMEILPHHIKGDSLLHYACNICKLLCATESELSKHVRLKHQQVYKTNDSGNTDYVIHRCTECNQHFRNRRALNCHMRCCLKGYKESAVEREMVGVDEEVGVFLGETEIKSRQLRQRSLQQQGTLFTCTICSKVFQSYSNLLRHRKLSHDKEIKKRAAAAENLLTKTRRRNGKNDFTRRKVYNRFFSQVSSMIAYNVKNCIYGNREHLNRNFMLVDRDDSLKVPILPQKSLVQKIISSCNIKLVPASEVINSRKPTKKSGYRSPRRVRSLTRIKAHKRSSILPPVPYDRPGYWKFLCQVCFQYFPNTLELFAHQDTVHKGVKTTYLEVAKETMLPLTQTHQPIGELGATTPQLIGQPSVYKCSKCNQCFSASSDLHPHILNCGANNLLKPLQISIPKIDVNVDQIYGKIRTKRKAHWQRSDNTTQSKITSHTGFRITKRNKISRLEAELNEQQEVERRLKMAESQMSPALVSPAYSLSKTSEYDWVDGFEPSEKPIIYSPRASRSVSDINTSNNKCFYCNQPFRTIKTLTRHMESTCEMKKMVEKSPNKNLYFESLKHDVEQEAVEPVSSAAELDSDFEYTPTKRQSSAQAKALSKFIHPARQCGPCYLCKKPNMSRRYTHLQQRSEGYVNFVKEKFEYISQQACICKSCDADYRHQYDSLRSGKSSTVLHVEPHAETKRKRGRPPKSSKARTSVSDSILTKYRKTVVTTTRRSLRSQATTTTREMLTIDLPVEQADNIVDKLPPTNNIDNDLQSASAPVIHDGCKTTMDIIRSSQPNTEAEHTESIIEVNGFGAKKGSTGITTLIDAVTAQVKDQPQLASRLIDAIHEAANHSDSSNQPSGSSTSARGSISLPTMLPSYSPARREVSQKMLPARKSLGTHRRNSQKPSSHSTADRYKNRKRPVMTEVAYKHMIEAIDAVATGQLGPRISQTGLGFTPRFNLEPREFTLDPEFWEFHPESGPASPDTDTASVDMPPEVRSLSRSSKNSRLASIIDRLSHNSSEAGSYDSGIENSFPPTDPEPTH